MSKLLFIMGRSGRLEVVFVYLEARVVGKMSPLTLYLDLLGFYVFRLDERRLVRECCFGRELGHLEN